MSHVHRFASFAMLLIAGAFLTGCNKVDLSTPKAAATTYAAAIERGDADTALKASTGGDEKIMEATVTLATKLKKLREAGMAKFGEDGKDISKNDPNMVKTVADAEFVEKDNAATVKKGPPKLKKIGSEWKVDVSDTMAAHGAFGLAMSEAAGKVAEEVTAELKDNKYKTSDEAKKAFTTKMYGAGGNPFGGE